MKSCFISSLISNRSLVSNFFSPRFLAALSVGKRPFRLWVGRSLGIVGKSSATDDPKGLFAVNDCSVSEISTTIWCAARSNFDGAIPICFSLGKSCRLIT